MISGTSIYDLMKLGGWKKIESVMVYAHLSADHLQAAAANRASMDAVYETALEVMK